jgi:hypothetical protein
MINFYQLDSNRWLIGDMRVPKGKYILEPIQNTTKFNLRNIESFVIINTYDAVNCCDANGVSYGTFDKIDAATSDFFLNTGVTKGSTTLALNGVLVSQYSNDISCKGYNACLVSVNLSGTGIWNISIQGKFTSDGTYMDLYDNNGNQASFGNISTNMLRTFIGMPDFIKIVATEITDGSTLTVKVQPINL